MIKKAIVIYILLLFPLFLSAQKVYLGSCTTSDGGQYKGEMVGGSPMVKVLQYIQTETLMKGNM